MRLRIQLPAHEFERALLGPAWVPRSLHCIPFFLVLSPCQVTHTCALLWLWDPRVEERDLSSSRASVLFRLAQSTHKRTWAPRPGLAYSLGTRQLDTFVKNREHLVSGPEEEGSCSGKNFRFEPLSLWLLSVVLSWLHLSCLLSPNPSLA